MHTRRFSGSTLSIVFAAFNLTSTPSFGLPARDINAPNTSAGSRAR